MTDVSIHLDCMRFQPIRADNACRPDEFQKIEPETGLVATSMPLVGALTEVSHRISPSECAMLRGCPQFLLYCLKRSHSAVSSALQKRLQLLMQSSIALRNEYPVLL